MGDLARQNRGQHSAEQATSRAQQLVDDMQAEQEAADNAPLGFKNYDAGEYRLFVPYPFTLEGRENGGAVLLGSRLGVTNTEVLAGIPLPIPTYLDENNLLNYVRQLAGRYGQSTYCSAIKAGHRQAFRCGWQGTPSLLGHQILGNIEFIRDGNNLVPIMCASPNEQWQCLTNSAFGNRSCGNKYPTWDQVQMAKAEVQTRLREQRTTQQLCEEVVYPSVQFKSDIVVHAASIAETKAPRVAAGEVAEDRTVVAGSGGSSLAETARQTKQTPRTVSKMTFDNAEGTTPAPLGFRSFVLQYCDTPLQCAEAKIIIPENAEVGAGTNGQYIFKTIVDGDPMMLYAGPADVSSPYRGLTDPDYIRMRDLANPNGWSHEKPDAVSTQQLTIEGRAALMTRFRFQRDGKRWWIGERLLIDNKPGQFLLGCTSPEEHFADAELLCTALVNSLRLP